MSLCTRAREAEAGKDRREERGDKQIKNTKPPEPPAAAGTALEEHALLPRAGCG